MRFNKGDRILVIGTPFGVPYLKDLPWPVKGVIYNYAHGQEPLNEPGSIARSLQEYYTVTLDDGRIRQQLDHYGSSRFIIPSCLLKRDKICPVCNAVIETYGSLELVKEHSMKNNKDERCYGSHAPLEL